MDLKNITWREFLYKLERKIHIYVYTKNMNSIPREVYLRRYSSYRHFIKNSDNVAKSSVNYIAARPNPGAGIGHQMANWMAGYYAAKFFNLKFAHIPFSDQHHPFIANSWDYFLGFGEGEEDYDDVKQKGYKTVLLPLFDFGNKNQVDIIRGIINSYKNDKVLFLCEQDQFLKNLPLVMEDCQRKFEASPARKNDHLLYDNKNFNIAIHVRRGDIMDDATNPNLSMRILSNRYYYNVFQNVLKTLNSARPVHIYFFSQGSPESYPEFSNIPNLHWCFDQSAQSSFLHFANADLLITSRSSFSYKPALLNRNGIKLVPDGFWHNYPEDVNWIVCNSNGTFDTNQLRDCLIHYNEH